MSRHQGESLASRFERFRDQEASAGSPLYAALAEVVAGSDELLELAAVARRGQQVPNLFFASVHQVLRQHPDHPLASFYPSVGGTRRPDETLGGAFRDFTASYEHLIRFRLETGLVQTNEPRRAGALVAGLSAIQPRGGAVVIEVGASAGLNLLFDRYRISMGDQIFGPLDSEVVFGLNSVGAPIPVRDWEVIERVGVDLAPIDVHDQDAVEWLESLVWPDQPARLELLRAALRLARVEPPRLLAGDLLEVLPEAVRSLPRAHDVIVFHSATWAHLTDDDRQRFVELMKRLGEERSVWWLSLEGGIHEYPVDREPVPCHLLGLIRLHAGSVERKVLARFDGHGAWIDWLGEPR